MQDRNKKIRELVEAIDELGWDVQAIEPERTEYSGSSGFYETGATIIRIAPAKEQKEA